MSGLRQRLLKSRARRLSEGQRLLRRYVEVIAENYPRSTVVLFGSRARGDELPYSDYDLAVILERVDDKLSLVEELRRLKPRGLPLDLIVVQADELSDPLIKGMLSEYKILYDGLKLRSLLPTPQSLGKDNS